MTPIRVLIVDDHPIFRYGMQALLRAIPDMEVVGEAASVAEALALAAAQRPHVVLMDIALPDGNGIEATESVVTAIACFVLAPDSYRDVIGSAIYLGGDTDTIAAMAGALSYQVLGGLQLLRPAP